MWIKCYDVEWIQERAQSPSGRVNQSDGEPREEMGVKIIQAHGCLSNCWSLVSEVRWAQQTSLFRVMKGSQNEWTNWIFALADCKHMAPMTNKLLPTMPSTLGGRDVPFHQNVMETITVSKTQANDARYHIQKFTISAHFLSVSVCFNVFPWWCGATSIGF